MRKNVPNNNVTYRVNGQVVYGNPLDECWNILLRITGRCKYAIDMVVAEEWVRLGRGFLKRKTHETRHTFTAKNKAEAMKLAREWVEARREAMRLAA